MRVLLLLACILSFSITTAQPGGGGGGQRGGDQQGGGQGIRQQQQRPEIREFNASEMVGIFNYDTDEVIKKIKLKKKKEEALKLEVRSAAVKYNNKVNEVALLNKDNFDTLNVYVNTIMKANRSSRGQGNQIGGVQQQGNRDYLSGDDSQNSMRKAIKLVKAKLQPAKNEVKQAEAELNENLELVLSEKQYKKWKAYQKKIKDDLKPKESSNNNTGMSRGGGGQVRPSGGGGGMR